MSQQAATGGIGADLERIESATETLARSLASPANLPGLPDIQSQMQMLTQLVQDTLGT
jgi:hypothetical protein